MCVCPAVETQLTASQGFGVNMKNSHRSGGTDILHPVASVRSNPIRLTEPLYHSAAGAFVNS